jgi:hypothetical protein
MAKKPIPEVDHIVAMAKVFVDFNARLEAIEEKMRLYESERAYCTAMARQLGGDVVH